ncbi:ABC transporter substrate-binding protein [Natronorubrum aibiense]|uniref:ABC transporter substrate-binding protein n=1 Tax=Natronorubrum aibiense TaxID=348826 RepID=A0A5P9P0U4_9EURY|nr:ABC transporter substrate-binding protein [Natronorubrum aibiense]QFU81752.1 ABC transporter substrate-binding protein [Natronorubrum aibiense]
MEKDSNELNSLASRRTVLAAGCGGIVSSLAGCTNGKQGIIDGSNNQLSVTILTHPTDSDRQSIQITRQLEKNLKAVGINTRIEPRTDSELWRKILLDRDYDCYVSHYPGRADPYYLYGLFHSKYAPESGWQNPFGFADAEMDELLEQQRSATGKKRKEAIDKVLHHVAQTHPIVPICIPPERRLVRTDRFKGWTDYRLGTRLGFLDLEPNINAFEGDTVLTAVTTDSQSSQNINPLSAAYRTRDMFVGILYDSLVVEDGDEIRPWLAESVEWDSSVATITLRPDCRFHDDKLVTAEDVAFTYEFLSDTSLGERDTPSPTPRYRELVDAVEAVEVLDPQTVRIRVGTSVDVGKQLFMIPILPKHVWEAAVKERLENNEEPTQGTWDIVTAASVPKIGSGPYAFVDQESRSQLRFERFDDHFTLRKHVDLPAPTADKLNFSVVPNSDLAVDQLSAGNVDMTASTLRPETVSDILDNSNLELLETPSWSFYHIGFNVRNAPFSNPHFRENVARLINREAIVDEIFNGQATPTVAPVVSEWIPDDLMWDGEAQYAPFFGNDNETTTNEETGTLNVDLAKRAFERDGFQYNDDRERLMDY